LPGIELALGKKKVDARLPCGKGVVFLQLREGFSGRFFIAASQRRGAAVEERFGVGGRRCGEIGQRGKSEEKDEREGALQRPEVSGMPSDSARPSARDRTSSSWK
jgi:hypothetical protein